MTVEQKRAANPETSAWVTASAGTGKTSVLTNRVLRLLFMGTKPSRILCLTFTRAAAAEMAIRINNQLSGWATMEEAKLRNELQELTGVPASTTEVSHARGLFAQVLDAPGGLHIETLHGFCQSVLRRFPIEAGVTPQFQVADERRQQELLSIARTRLLREARHGTDDALADALATISATIDEGRFDDLMVSLTGSRDRLSHFLHAFGGSDGAIAALRTELGLAPGETAETIIKEFSENAAFDSKALAEVVTIFQDGGIKEKQAGITMLAWLTATPSGRVAMFENYIRVFLTIKDAQRKNFPLKKTREEKAAATATYQMECDRVLAIVMRLKAAGVARSTSALVLFGARLLQYYEREKARFGVLDYDDQIERTKSLLVQPGMAPWVLFKLDGGIDHILVDEAQDTSPAQWDIIAGLAGDFFPGDGARELVRTLFAVGDEKQSIFSFQGADPYALSAMRQTFKAQAERAGLPWDDVPLARSFRSVAPVLTAVDATFSSESAAEGVALDGGEIIHEAFREGQAGRVELWPTITPIADDAEDEAWAAPVKREAADEPKAQLATVIADRIQTWLEGTDPVAADAMLPARNRRITPGDIMIIVRTRSAFVDQLVSALKIRQVAVAGVDRMILSDQLPVMDLMALGDFLLLPEDDLTLAVVLKGPLIELSEDALFALAHGRGKSTLWQTLLSRRLENANYAAACNMLEPLLNRVDFVPPYELFADILSARGGRAALIRRLGNEINDPVDEFLSLAQDYQATHPPSLQGFLQWVRLGKSEIKRDLEHGGGKVRIMTAHGAKGLQAPVVFLADTTGIPRHAPELLWHRTDETEMPLWPGKTARDCAASADARADDKRSQGEEYRRLLYVAMTRAEDRLYVCGAENKNGRAEGCWYDLVAAGLRSCEGTTTVAATGGLTGDILCLSTEQTAMPKDEKPDAPTVMAFGPVSEALRSRPDAEPEPTRPLAPSREFGQAPTASSPLGEKAGEAMRRGRLVHRLLELLPDLDPDARSAAASAWLARPGHALDPEEQKTLARQVMAILDNPALTALFGPESLAEVPLTALVGKRAISGQVDRLVVTNDNVIIVDYKTGRSPAGTESVIPHAYFRQMSAYRAVLRQVLPERQIRCGLLYTGDPTLCWLTDEELDRHAP
jgi:ATP-dependent helicase/nuclease subunit A